MKITTKRVFTRLYRLKFTIISVAVIMYLSFGKFDVDPKDIPPFPHFDKFAHSLMYAALAVAYSIDRCRKIRAAKYKYVILKAIAMVVSLGIFTEFVQWLLPYRGCDFYDFIADVAGGVISSIIGVSIIPIIYPKVKKLLKKFKQ